MGGHQDQQQLASCSPRKGCYLLGWRDYIFVQLFVMRSGRIPYGIIITHNKMNYKYSY